MFRLISPKIHKEQHGVIIASEWLPASWLGISQRPSSAPSPATLELDSEINQKLNSGCGASMYVVLFIQHLSESIKTIYVLLFPLVWSPAQKEMESWCALSWWWIQTWTLSLSFGTLLWSTVIVLWLVVLMKSDNLLNLCCLSVRTLWLSHQLELLFTINMRGICHGVYVHIHTCAYTWGVYVHDSS